MGISFYIVVSLLGVVTLLFIRELLVSYFIRSNTETNSAKIIAEMAKKLNRIEYILNHNSERISADIPKYSEIDNLVLTARASMKASRGYILRFHNGCNFSTNDPVWKFSMTHETTDSTIVSVAERTKDILVSNVLSFITPIFSRTTPLADGISEIESEVTADDHCKVFKVDSSEVLSGSFRGYLLMRGIKNLIYAPIFDTKGHPIGMLCFDYVNSDIPKFVDNDYACRKMVEYSSILTTMVGDLLADYNKTEEEKSNN